MVGSVLHQELLLGSRRNRLYALRWIYVGWLVAQIVYFLLGFLWAEAERARTMRASPESTARNQASAAGVVGSEFAETFVWQQLVILLLATPAFVAGAITDEKRRGTLQYLLTADLDTRHIILGKLFGRVAQVGLLTLAGLPLFCLMAGFGGVEPATLILTLVTMLAPLFALSAATLLASVLCRQTRDAVLLLYALGLAGGLAVWLIGGPLDYLNPLFTMRPAWAPLKNIEWPDLLLRLSVEIAAWGTVGGVCLALAVWRLRPVYIRELESPVAKQTWLQGERVPIGDDPVRWRERYVERLMPPSLKAVLLPLLMLPYGLVYLVTPRAAAGRAQRLSLWPGVVLTAALTTASSLFILWLYLPAGATPLEFGKALGRLDFGRLLEMMPADASYGFQVQGVVVMLLGSLIVGVRCSGAITDERERQTWEAVLLTPLSARQLVEGKLWGVMAACYWYLLAYAIPAGLLSALGGLACLGWTALWLVVAVLAMYYLGAAGIWCSARSKTSWGSLLGTMALGYLLGAVLYGFGAVIVLSPLAGIGNFLLYLIDRSLGTQLYTPSPPSPGFWTWVAWFVTSGPFVVLSCLGLAGIFLILSRLFLSWAQRWIADRERTRHWYDEPVYRRARRAPYRPRYAT